MFLRLEYNSDLFDRGRIVRMAEHAEGLMAAMLSAPERPLGQLEYISDEERRLLLEVFNDTGMLYPRGSTLPELLRSCVRSYSERPAVICGSESMSYGELDERSDRLAAYLRLRYGVGREQGVGVALERGMALVLSMVGILKAGGYCVPVDVLYPSDRREYILSTGKCVVVIDGAEWLRFEASEELYGSHAVPLENESGDLSYVIYTSGSTGRPKGCMLEHRGVINHIYGKIKELGMESGERWTHSSELHFVGGIWQLWAPLVTGGVVVLTDREELMDLEQLVSKAQGYGSRVLEIIPSQLNEHLSAGRVPEWGSIRTLILTGERLTPYFVRRCYGEDEELVIINTYGQTESSDVTSSHRISRAELEEEKVLNGRPVGNMRHYVLSETGMLCPVGVVGEICTSGDGVCRGYINDKEQSEKKFVESPYERGVRMHRTGDLGRWTEAGLLEVLGRKDEQVKIRGFRVDLGEVEEVLKEVSGMSEAVVVVNGRGELRACMVLGGALGLEELRRRLQGVLPGYMVPVEYVEVGSMPLLSNGKVDRKGLGSLEGVDQVREAAYEGPRNEVERELVRIWEELLQREGIGIRDNFFHLGGHSLKATRLVSMIHRQLQSGIKLGDVFAYPTIEGISALITADKWAQNSKTKREENRNIVEI
jgi:amino acid adenylation domain-containing protein